MEEQKYTKEFWFDQHYLHGEVHGYDERYYANHLYESVVKKINDIPDCGHIVVLGSNNCVSFQVLVDHFGIDRCIGIDIANPKNHPAVKVKNILSFDESDDVPISFVHNDLGSYPHTPLAKIKAQMWAAKNVVKGGYVLSRNNLNTIKFPVEEYMNSLGFLNIPVLALEGFMDLSNLSVSVLEGHMLSKRNRPKIWEYEL